MTRKLLAAALLLTASMQGSAQNKLIHYWHFNQFAVTATPYSTPNLPTFKANFSTIDTNKAVCMYTKLPGTSAAYVSTLDAYYPTAAGVDTPNVNWNSRLGTPAGNSIRVRNPSDSMMLTFGIPSTHYQNLLVRFVTESSSATSGMKYQLYDYSVDSGTTWTNTALSKTIDTTTNATFDSIRVKFNDVLDPLVKNNPKLIFRIRFSGQNTGTSGNNRFDNFTLDGDTLITIAPQPTTKLMLHYWHFNNLTATTAYSTPAIPVIKANYSRIDTNKTGMNYSKIPGTSAAYLSTIDAYAPTNAATDTPFINWNSRMAQPAGYSIRVRNPSDSMMLTFNIPTPQFKNIVVKFATESSSATSGMKYQLYDYSIDSGMTWRTTALSKTIDTTISATYDTVTVKFDDAVDTMVRNNSKLVFRIRFSGQNTGTSGNNRFDNVTVDGDSIINNITPPNAVLAVGGTFPSVKLYPNPATAEAFVEIDFPGEKQITLYNIDGQKIVSFNTALSRIPVALNRYSSGVYIIHVRLSNGQEKTMRFTKE